MLSELDGMQESAEQIWQMEMEFTVKTRVSGADEFVQRTYTFGYAEEWDKWTLIEYAEERANDVANIGDRDWRETERLLWNESETAEVTIPPEVADRLKEVTGSDSVTIQSPSSPRDELPFTEYYSTK